MAARASTKAKIIAEYRDQQLATLKANLSLAARVLAGSIILGFGIAAGTLLFQMFLLAVYS